MQCTDEQMVTFSSFLLRDRALEWWRAVQRRYPDGVPWIRFKEEFTDKFVLASYRDAKAEEFFSREDEVSKTKRFVVGLSQEIWTTVASTAHTQYDQVVEAAVRDERSMGLKSQATHSQGQKRSGSTWV